MINTLSVILYIVFASFIRADLGQGGHGRAVRRLFVLILLYCVILDIACCKIDYLLFVHLLVLYANVLLR